eukprot:58550-Amphidinium_carterae.1
MVHQCDGGPPSKEDASTRPMRFLHDREVANVHSSWFLICMLAAAPGALYAAVQAVPGFLQVSGKLCGRSTDSAALQLVGMMVEAIFLPGPDGAVLVTLRVLGTKRTYQANHQSLNNTDTNTTM